MTSDPQPQPLLDLVARQQAGAAYGIYSICSANTSVLDAGFARALVDDTPLLVEATCNQVNQDGGYTGQTPAQFVRHLLARAARHRFARDRLIIGGDHLGPSPWQKAPAAEAMARAQRLVRDCVAAGYQKIHLDASMKLGDDDPQRPLPRAVAADRAAQLAATAEAAHANRVSRVSGTAGPPRTLSEGPLYVIGTEVPLPGGTHGDDEGLTVTDPADVAATIALTRRAFHERGLEAAWERVIAVVVQPGVEFGDRELHPYEAEKARPLSRFIEGHAHLVFEAHSTDYQTRSALRALVRDHFAILKVGPALTFAFREAVFALSAIEKAWLQDKETRADVPRALEQAMLAQPEFWLPYYHGDARAQALARKYSFSDRSRYYWPVPSVHAALQQLLQNLSAQPIPLTLLSQYLPRQYRRIRTGQLANDPQAIILDKIDAVLEDYAYACGYLPDGAGSNGSSTA